MPERISHNWILDSEKPPPRSEKFSHPPASLHQFTPLKAKIVKLRVYLEF